MGCNSGQGILVGEAMADPQRCRLLRPVLENQNKCLLQQICREVGPYGVRSDARKADVVTSILEWAQSDARRHANVCQALLSAFPKNDINYVISVHCGRGHGGKSKKEAIQKFIAADSRRMAANRDQSITSSSSSSSSSS